MQQTDPIEPQTGGPERKSFQRRIARAIWLYAVVPYLFVVVIFTLFQRKLMYRPTVADNLSVQRAGLDADRVKDILIEAPDGTELRGWLLKSVTNENASLVVYFPGNSLNRFERVDDLREVTRAGFDVLICDYRGYGDSGGSPSEPTLTSDARLVVQEALKLGYAQERMVIFGESLGGAVALSLWSDREFEVRPAGLILSSTFSSMPETVGWHYPLFPFRFLLLDTWRSIEWIGAVQCPITIYHGDRDTMAPIEHARRLASAATDASFEKISAGEHNQIPMHRLRSKLTEIADW